MVLGLRDVALGFFRLAIICFTSPALSGRLLYAILHLKGGFQEKLRYPRKKSRILSRLKLVIAVGVVRFLGVGIIPMRDPVFTF